MQAADADVQASEEQLHDVLVSLLAEVALNYVDVRSLQERIAVAQQNLAAQSQSSDISGWRYQAGLGTALEASRPSTRWNRVVRSCRRCAPRWRKP